MEKQGSQKLRLIQFAQKFQKLESVCKRCFALLLQNNFEANFKAENYQQCQQAFKKVCQKVKGSFSYNSFKLSDVWMENGREKTYQDLLVKKKKQKQESQAKHQNQSTGPWFKNQNTAQYSYKASQKPVIHSVPLANNKVYKEKITEIKTLNGQPFKGQYKLNSSICDSLQNPQMLKSYPPLETNTGNLVSFCMGSTQLTDSNGQILIPSTPIISKINYDEKKISVEELRKNSVWRFSFKQNKWVEVGQIRINQAEKSVAYDQPMLDVEELKDLISSIGEKEQTEIEINGQKQISLKEIQEKSKKLIKNYEFLVGETRNLSGANQSEQQQRAKQILSNLKKCENIQVKNNEQKKIKEAIEKYPLVSILNNIFRCEGVEKIIKVFPYIKQEQGAKASMENIIKVSLSFLEQTKELAQPIKDILITLFYELSEVVKKTSQNKFLESMIKSLHFLKKLGFDTDSPQKTFIPTQLRPIFFKNSHILTSHTGQSIDSSNSNTKARVVKIEEYVKNQTQQGQKEQQSISVDKQLKVQNLSTLQKQKIEERYAFVSSLYENQFEKFLLQSYNSPQAKKQIEELKETQQKNQNTYIKDLLEECILETASITKNQLLAGYILKFLASLQSKLLQFINRTKQQLICIQESLQTKQKIVREAMRPLTQKQQKHNQKKRVLRQVITNQRQQFLTKIGGATIKGFQEAEKMKAEYVDSIRQEFRRMQEKLKGQQRLITQLRKREKMIEKIYDRRLQMAYPEILGIEFDPPIIGNNIQQIVSNMNSYEKEVLQNFFGNQPEISLRGGGPKVNFNRLPEAEKQRLRTLFEQQKKQLGIDSFQRWLTVYHNVDQNITSTMRNIQNSDSDNNKRKTDKKIDDFIAETERKLSQIQQSNLSNDQQTLRYFDSERRKIQNEINQIRIDLRELKSVPDEIKQAQKSISQYQNKKYEESKTKLNKKVEDLTTNNKKYQDQINGMKGYLQEINTELKNILTGGNKALDKASLGKKLENLLGKFPNLKNKNLPFMKKEQLEKMSKTSTQIQEKKQKFEKEASFNQAYTNIVNDIVKNLNDPSQYVSILQKYLQDLKQEEQLMKIIQQRQAFKLEKEKQATSRKQTEQTQEEQSKGDGDDFQ